MNLYIKVGRTNILRIFSLLIHDQGLFLHLFSSLSALSVICIYVYIYIYIYIYTHTHILCVYIMSNFSYIYIKQNIIYIYYIYVYILFNWYLSISFWGVLMSMVGLPWWLSGKESTCQYKRCRFNTSIRKLLWSRQWQPILVSCLRNPVDRGNWWATVHGGIKSRTWLSDWAPQNVHLISNSITSMLVYRKVIDFCILNFCPSTLLVF